MKPPSPLRAISGDSSAGTAQHPAGSGPPQKGNFPGREQAPDPLPTWRKHPVPLITLRIYIRQTQKGLTGAYKQPLQRVYFKGLRFSPRQRSPDSSCPSFGRAADLAYNQTPHGVFSDIQAAICNRETASSWRHC